MLTRMLHTEMLDTGGPRGGIGATCLSQLSQNILVDGSMPDVHVLAFEPAHLQGEPNRVALNTLRFSGL